jgi:hypothetical protein
MFKIADIFLLKQQAIGMFQFLKSGLKCVKSKPVIKDTVKTSNIFLSFGFPHTKR